MTGREIPKNLSIAVPTSSIVSRKRVVLIAIFSAIVRYTAGGAAPTRPMNISASPSGFTSGTSALKASPKNLLNSATAEPFLAT
jgi:hypothetical protein